ncbi:unnamed protein product [Thelazia callipaeda]|uniref:EGF-like domain-containing protein n=1 Tax=Thelazia callipaeda TaxID=103827 RepID=A0A0N5D326_THECL|nr:unnamed protein product [Thelazia callipaeda]
MFFIIGLSNSISLMRKFHSLPKIPYIPPAKHRKQHTGDLETNFDPCKIMQFCQNGGTCVSKKGSCWCKQGFTGSLCEYSEELRQCEEEYCLHKGIGRLIKSSNNTTKCECECQKYHAGKRVSSQRICKNPL